MKILHTSDLHLGRQFNGIPLDEDHDAILNQITQTILDRHINALIIAGDIFDRAAPPESAVRQFNSFLSRVASETDAAVIMIAGNHDSSARISSMSIMTDTRRALIRGTISNDEKPIILSDEHGSVAFSGIPFSNENAAKECFNDEKLTTPEDVLTAQITSAQSNVPKDARWIIIAHTFVSGALGSESERPLARVGGIETVSPNVFDGADYTALGHLHRPQTAGSDNIRYSGSPLAFGFDEVDQEKSMNLIDLDAAGNVTVESIPFKPIRNVRILRGKHAEILLAEPSNDFVKIILTDEIPIIDAMKRLRETFSNACELIYERDEQSSSSSATDSHATKSTDPIDVIGDFLEYVREERMNDQETELVASAMHGTQSEGDVT